MHSRVKAAGEAQRYYYIFDIDITAKQQLEKKQKLAIQWNHGVPRDSHPDKKPSN